MCDTVVCLFYEKLSYALLEEINIYCTICSILIKGERPEMTGYVISNILGSYTHSTLRSNAVDKVYLQTSVDELGLYTKVDEVNLLAKFDEIDFYTIVNEVDLCSIVDELDLYTIVGEVVIYLS